MQECLADCVVHSETAVTLTLLPGFSTGMHETTRDGDPPTLAQGHGRV